MRVGGVRLVVVIDDHVESAFMYSKCRINSVHSSSWLLLVKLLLVNKVLPH